jgi:hypothetical protein
MVFHLIIPHVDTDNDEHYEHTVTLPTSVWMNIEHVLSHIKHLSTESYSANLHTKVKKEELKKVDKYHFFQSCASIESGYIEVISSRKIKHREHADALRSCISHALSRRGPPFC